SLCVAVSLNLPLQASATDALNAAATVTAATEYRRCMLSASFISTSRSSLRMHALWNEKLMVSVRPRGARVRRPWTAGAGQSHTLRVGRNCWSCRSPDEAAPPQAGEGGWGRVSYTILPTMVAISAFEKARRVWVRTLPRAPV